MIAEPPIYLHIPAVLDVKSCLLTLTLLRLDAQPPPSPALPFRAMGSIDKMIYFRHGNPVEIALVGIEIPDSR